MLRRDVEFHWYLEHQRAFDNLKELIENATALQYFDPKKSSVVQVDASMNALGAALVQEGKVIAYAAKSLTGAETRYANNERELLACVFGAERFHTYLYGAPFIIESDHQPLEMITKKSLSAAPARLQRMLLRLQRYDYSIRYRPAKEMVLADGLSRIPTSVDSPEIQLNVKVCFVQFSDRKLDEIKTATKEDPILYRLMEYVYQGFPQKQRDLHAELKPYWSFRDELSVENGLLLKGEQIIIPSSLQQEYLQAIHSGHQGITRCQQRAKSSIYWPGINEEIAELVNRCELCQKHQSSQAKEKMESIVADIPNVPWNTVSSDLFTFEGRNFIIIADYFSKYPLVEQLDSMSSKTVAQKTMRIFSMFGIPNTMISDNGPQFIGKEYQELMNMHGISHITSSPHHPQGHGFIERMIRTVKSFFHKSNLDEALLSYRTTPLGPNRPSPAELMFGRKVQNNLPVYVKAREQVNQYSDSTVTRELPDLYMNQPIFHQDVAKRTWSHGVVEGIGPAPRSYTIRCTDTGRLLCRNRALLRPRTVMFKDYVKTSEIEDDIEPPNMRTVSLSSPMVPETQSPSKSVTIPSRSPELVPTSASSTSLRATSTPSPISVQSPTQLTTQSSTMQATAPSTLSSPTPRTPPITPLPPPVLSSPKNSAQRRSKPPVRKPTAMNSQQIVSRYGRHIKKPQRYQDSG